MINKETYLNAALKLHEIESELIEKYGQDKFNSQKLLCEFIELDCEADNKNFALINTVEFGLRRFLQRQDVVPNVRDPKIREIFNRLSRDNVDEAMETDFFEDPRVEQLEEELLWSWWSPREHVQLYLSAKPLITVGDLPSRIGELITEARQCYAFSQHNAVIALGRMILEVAITDIGERKNLISPSETLDDVYRNYPPPPSKTADRLLGSKGSPRRERFRKLYDIGSAQIHSKATEHVPAFDYFRDVLEFVSEQYAIDIRK